MHTLTDKLRDYVLSLKERPVTSDNNKRPTIIDFLSRIKKRSIEIERIDTENAMVRDVDCGCSGDSITDGIADHTKLSSDKTTNKKEAHFEELS